MVCLCLDAVFLSSRSSNQLNVKAFYLVAFYAFSAQMRFDQGYELVVDHVPEDVIVLVVEVDVLECVYIEVHLVVRAQSVVVDSQHRHVCQDIVY